MLILIRCLLKHNCSSLPLGLALLQQYNLYISANIVVNYATKQKKTTSNM